MSKLRIIFFACICMSIVFQSCSDESEELLIDEADLLEAGIHTDQYLGEDEVSLLLEDEQQTTPAATSRGITPQLVGPDLIISRIDVNFPTNVTPCGVNPMLDANCNVVYTISIDVQNIGNQPALGGHQAALFNTITPGLTFRTVNQTLAPGQTGTVVIGPFQICTTPVPPTIEQFIVFADFNKDVAETREDNNRSRPLNFCLN